MSVGRTQDRSGKLITVQAERLAKARKLLEALVEAHDTRTQDGEHAWRECRRCLAREELEYDSSVPLWQAIIAALDAAAQPREDDDGSYLWQRCYQCGHRLSLASDGCPQCGVLFDGRTEPKRWPEQCGCERCAQARQSA